MRLIGMLDAVYPSESHGNVTMIWAVPDSWAPKLQFEGYMAFLVAYYHKQIGPAYSLDDFAYTFWLAVDTPEEIAGEAFFHLVGQYMSAQPGAPDTVRPVG